MSAVRTFATLTICSLGLMLSACGSRIAEIGREPELSPVGSGLAHASVVFPTEPEPMPASHNGNSLWQDRTADLFKDRRARRIGDVITVKISVKDRATLDNSSKRSRDGSSELGLDVTHGVDWRGWSSQGSANVGTNFTGNTSSEGKGAVARSENIDLQIAAVVSNVLPNGNLIIQGAQELRVNYELRVLNVSGVIDVRDIAADNTIPYERIAEARMSYGGRGRIMEVQQPAWGHQIVDMITPF